LPIYYVLPLLQSVI